MTIIIGLVLSLLFFIATPATASGSLGHRTVAYLAQKHLTTEGAAFVNSLLDGERHFGRRALARRNPSHARLDLFRRMASYWWVYLLGGLLLNLSY